MIMFLLQRNQATSEEIPMVDIVHLLQNSSTTLVDHLETGSCSLSSHHAQGTLQKFSVIMPSEIAIANLFTHSHEIHSTPCSQIDNTLPMLTAAKAVLIQSLTMERHYITIYHFGRLSFF
ncbi:hypothetical protein F2Q70_00009285 [Brassica cretica]|uniref:Uncharacterized protein n=2 Tax=Brassica cretica TaxID=69181 RepID=A0A8S9JGE8_BRACR|nr:hypothetical protein F2Q68_00002379 [Brassica cretica]KAF2612796.1 hypothetical protein F2Q70_00009285 [Brassica cretica]KAF3548894.1 hypothetical protein DY000_02003184 [Brassica cretica]